MFPDIVNIIWDFGKATLLTLIELFLLVVTTYRRVFGNETTVGARTASQSTNSVPLADQTLSSLFTGYRLLYNESHFDMSLLSDTMTVNPNSFRPDVFPVLVLDPDPLNKLGRFQTRGISTHTLFPCSSLLSGIPQSPLDLFDPLYAQTSTVGAHRASFPHPPDPRGPF